MAKFIELNRKLRRGKADAARRRGAACTVGGGLI